MNRHDALRATWAPGQYWETAAGGYDIWVPVGMAGRAQPLWDERQEYRRRADLEQPDTTPQALHDMLNTVRTLREQLAPQYDELRQAFNAAADRLDALISALQRARANGSHSEKGGHDALGTALRTDVTTEGCGSVTNAPGEDQGGA